MLRRGETLDLADRFFAAIPKGDLEAVRAIYAPDAQIWHNNDQATQSVEENLQIGAMTRRGGARSPFGSPWPRRLKKSRNSSSSCGSLGSCGC